MNDERYAAEGQCWVCGACGRVSKTNDRYDTGDESCVLNAVLCWAKKNDDGRYWAVEEK